MDSEDRENILVLRCTDEWKIFFATFMLKAEADCLWNMTQGAMTFKDDEPMTWALFVDAFYDWHFPQTLQEQKRAKFMELVQGIMKVYQYDAKILNLVHCADHRVMDDEWLARMFERGLKPSIRPHLPCETENLC